MVVGDIGRVAMVEDDLIMEFEEFGDGFNDSINVGEVTNSKIGEEINLAAGIVEEVIQSNQDSLPIPKINDLKHDSRELTSANSALMDSISREVGLEKFKEIPRACPNELFRRRIEELDFELKKFDEHVTGGARAVSKNSTI